MRGVQADPGLAGTRLRVVGARHSWSPVVVAEDVAIQLNRLAGMQLLPDRSRVGKTATFNHKWEMEMEIEMEPPTYK